MISENDEGEEKVGGVVGRAVSKVTKKDILDGREGEAGEGWGEKKNE